MVRQTTIPTRVGPVPCRIWGDGLPVLASHGMLVDGRLWDQVAAELPPSVALIAPDLPLGAHATPVPDRAMLTAEGIAGALIDILDHLGIQTAVAVGSDTGGALTQIAVGDHLTRFSGLVLCSCDALSHCPPPLLRPLRPIVGTPGLLRTVGWAFSLKPTFASPGPLNLLCKKPVDESLVTSWLSPFRTSPAIRSDFAAFFKTMRRDLTLKAAEQLRTFSGPTVIAWSRGERLFPRRDAEQLAAMIPRATLHWIDDALTLSPLDQPSAVAQAIGRVITRTGLLRN